LPEYQSASGTASGQVALAEPPFDFVQVLAGDNRLNFLFAISFDPGNTAE